MIPKRYRTRSRNQSKCQKTCQRLNRHRIWPENFIPINEDDIDRLLGMSTIVPDRETLEFVGVFHEEFEVFAAQSYQRFPVRSTTSVDKRNKNIRDRKQHMHATADDDEAVNSCKTLKCTHSIKQQKRGKGERTHRVVRFTGCTAQINVTLQKKQDGDYYIYLNVKGSHNHALSRELWEYYAENRRIVDPIVLQTVGECVKAVPMPREF
ncbi:FAR1 DNA binding domain [Phytophthora cactorum]|nr:FAR1 DNA binding domain [Phytophthora cactorum]